MAIDITHKLSVNIPSATWTHTTYDRRMVKNVNSELNYPYIFSEPSRKHEETFQGSVDVVIDLPEIIQLIARAAMSTKGGKSKLLNGLVTAKVRTRTSVSKVTTDVPLTEGYVEVEK